MAALRTPYQGVWNILRFNWHFYVLALVAVLTLYMFATSLDHPLLHMGLVLLAGLVVFTTLVSLAVSHYIYDRSGLYELHWADGTKGVMVNIHAGFDETSALLRARFNPRQLIALDFYDPKKHTEVSIRRARKAYAPFPGTRAVRTDALPLADASADRVFVILAAHEVRDEAERIACFQELRRVIGARGRVVVLEHLRDVPNFLAYTIGFFHFHSRATWMRTFERSGLQVSSETKVTPFLSCFNLVHHDHTP
jgi:SAM-dependent methyltransferase